MKRAPCDISVSLKVRTVLWAKDIYRAVKGPILANATKLHSEAVTAAHGRSKSNFPRMQNLAFREVGGGPGRC